MPAVPLPDRTPTSLLIPTLGTLAAIAALRLTFSVFLGEALGLVLGSQSRVILSLAGIWLFETGDILCHVFLPGASHRLSTFHVSLSIRVHLC